MRGLAIALGILVAVTATAPLAAERVPFVGCPSDGQTGPIDAPTGSDKSVELSQSQGARLAYYKAENWPGVLAPRGWRCAGVYGSNGAVLFVTPEPIEPSEILKSDWKGIDGNGLQLTFRSGGTSGRFDVARVIARVFPKHRAFVESVIAEGLWPATDFPFGPYPKDKLSYRSDELVEFETPANATGLGAVGALDKSGGSVRGFAGLTGPDTNLTLLRIRLPNEMQGLTAAIIQGSEQELGKPATD